MGREQPWLAFLPPGSEKFDADNMRHRFLGGILREAAESFGDRPSCTTLLPNGAAASVSFRELDRHANDFAIYLREVIGLAQGGVVAIMSPNCVDYPIASFGIFKAGCIATNINPLYTRREMAYQLKDSGAKVLLIIDLFGDKVDAVIAETDVEHVITLSLLDFFAPVKKLLFGAIMKYVKRVVPAIRTPHLRFVEALARGRARHEAVNPDLSAYLAGLTTHTTAVYQYTGGTTGQAKGAELSHYNILANAYQMEVCLEGRVPGGDTALVALPVYHIFAFTVGMIFSMIFGNHSVLVPSPRPPSNLRAGFENYPVSLFFGVNTLFAAMLRETWLTRDVVKDLRYIIAGGMALRENVAIEWEEKLGVPISQGYGLTESACAITFSPQRFFKLNYIGVPLPGIDVKILDEDGNPVAPSTAGELVAKGPNIMKGYLHRDAETVATLHDGWLHTGDIAVMDDDGFFRLVDRKKDMILVSGFNVYPNEVEDVLITMPGITEVAVIGVPDEHAGEVPKAFIVATDRDLNIETIRVFCKDKLTGYKRPVYLEFLDEIPKSPVGKILRKNLRNRDLKGI